MKPPYSITPRRADKLLKLVASQPPNTVLHLHPIEFVAVAKQLGVDTEQRAKRVDSHGRWRFAVELEQGAVTVQSDPDLPNRTQRTTWWPECR